MLTDKQQKYYIKIGLLSQSKGLTEMEEKGLQRAKKWFDRGDEFHIVINSLCLTLQNLTSERLQGKLTPPVNKLYEDLIADYGQPQKSDLRILAGPSNPVWLDDSNTRS
ncbi:MAG: hypothetical protein FWE43_01070 [Streptococcaceae bacterium]|nr:hypothetical protein [Streptococcaceae bacterium]MCL2681068.1 hypothetical protein [Streptococcaceae bacterium]